MSTAELPTRSRPDGRFRGGRLRLVEGACHPNPPDPPAHLSKREAELYDEAWAEPESCLWRSDAARVGRWAHLAARAETDPASWVFVQLNMLERQLVMTPLARAAAGVALEPGDSAGAHAAAAPHTRRSRLSPDVRREFARLRRDDPLGALEDGDAIPMTGSSMENTDKPPFSPSEQALIDEAVSTGGPIMKQPWMQGHVVRRMNKEVERIRATMPKPPKRDVEGARYHAARRVKWRGNFATHEAGTDGLPICPQRSAGWEEPKNADEMEHLGPGPVNCGHCENAR